MIISVAMAVYNGEQYIKQQIESIILQLGDNDELVISYNESYDSTFSILEEFRNQDKRIKIYICPTKGVIKNFENAIKHCIGDIIFLSDQDDVWMHNKIELVLNEFNRNDIGGVVHTCYLVDENLRRLKINQNIKETHVISLKEIIIQNPVQGSCLAFKKELVELFLPFPSKIPMHDSWIGIIISSHSKLLYINKPLILYRQHAGQATKRKHQSMCKMIKDRIYLLFALLMCNKS